MDMDIDMDMGYFLPCPNGYCNINETFYCCYCYVSIFIFIYRVSKIQDMNRYFQINLIWYVFFYLLFCLPVVSGIKFTSHVDYFMLNKFNVFLFIKSLNLIAMFHCFNLTILTYIGLKLNNILFRFVFGSFRIL